MHDATPINMLEKRRIEAAILGEVYDVLLERHGKDEAEVVIGAAVMKSASTQAGEMRDQQKDHDLLSLAALTKQWEAGGALKRDIHVKTAERYEFDMVHCAYAEMYKEMGLGHIGHLLSCIRDQNFAAGFNPDIELEVTQTIMKGAPHCDFRYRMNKTKP